MFTLRSGLLSIFLCCRLFARAEPIPPEARHGFQTKLVRREKVGEAPPAPPSNVLKLVHYRAPLGDNAAHISLAPIDGKKHPAIIWIVGGFSNSIGDAAWAPSPQSNDQSASGFRGQGIVMMYPSLRGGNTNPGCKEGGYGEVDDVLAAAKYLASLNYVDASRIYLSEGRSRDLVRQLTGSFRNEPFIEWLSTPETTKWAIPFGKMGRSLIISRGEVRGSGGNFHNC
jgi:hypothetical protein